MTKEQYLNFHKQMTEKMIQITADKNADYTGEGDNPFKNFTLVEDFGITSTETGFLTRMTDKMSRLASFNQLGTFQVKGESVEDTLLDLANYCILFAGYLRSKTTYTTPTEYIPYIPTPEDNAEYEQFIDSLLHNATRFDKVTPS